MSEPNSSEDPPKRRPSQISWESYAEFRIRQAQEQGKFDQLPGFGKPIPGIDDPLDDDWWLKRKLKDENLSIVHPILEVRAKIETVRAALDFLRDEEVVRKRLSELNTEIHAALASPLPPPPVAVLPLDIEQEVSAWRRRRS
jgi:hypothetical protein